MELKALMQTRKNAQRSTSADISAATSEPAGTTAAPTTSEQSKPLSEEAIVERTFQYKPRSDRKKDMQLLWVVEIKASTRCLMKKMDPRYEIVSREQLTTQLLPEHYNSDRQKLMGRCVTSRLLQITGHQGKWKLMTGRPPH